MNKLLEPFQANLGEFLPNLLGALAILVVGWLVAVIIRAGVRRVLGRANLNQRFASSTGKSGDYESGIAMGVFFVLMLIVFLAFLNALQLHQVSEPIGLLISQILEYLPRLGAAAVLLAVAWLLATLVRTLVRRGLGATSLDEKMSVEAGMKPVSENVSTAVYWVVFLLFLPAVLSALDMRGLLAPVEQMTRKMLDMVPNILAAVLIGFVGWFVAKLVRDVLSNLLAAAGADRLGERVGLAGTMTLSRLAGYIVYILVLVPALISALSALKIDAIAQPATSMLQTLMDAIPGILAAALILGIAWFVAKLASELLRNLLAGVGFDRVPVSLGLGEVSPGAGRLSAFVGKVVAFFIMIFAAMEASHRLGFGQVAELTEIFLQFGGQVLLGIVTIGVGLWIANLARSTMLRVMGDEATTVANVVRFAILGIVVAMGLRSMGLADDIVNLAFGLTLGAMAVAFALAFGLGGRGAAGTLAEHWVERIRSPRSRTK